MASSRITQFSYFNQLLGKPVWKPRKILDFGGNVGGFLVGAGDHVNHDDYWCMDCHQAALEEGRSYFPQAHFVHYNRYSAEYNPDGIRSLPIPDCGLKFDIILAFSVFTHTHQTELLELVEQLQNMLQPQGVLAFTFTDASYDRSLTDPNLPPGTDVRKHLVKRQHLIPSVEIDDMIERAKLSSWCILIDGKLYIDPGNGLTNQEREGTPWESYCTYFSAEYMATLFPDAAVLPPVHPEWQHCCVLPKP